MQGKNIKFSVKKTLLQKFQKQRFIRIGINISGLA